MWPTLDISFKQKLDHQPLFGKWARAPSQCRRERRESRPGGGGTGAWVNFWLVCAAGLSEPPTPLWSILWPITDLILVTFRQICHFRDHNLVTFYFYEFTHFLHWMKNTLLFICGTNILVRLLTVNIQDCLTPKNPKMCDPILVTLFKMRPHPAAHPH